MEREEGSCVACFKVLLEQKGKLTNEDIDELGKGLKHCGECLTDLQDKYQEIVDKTLIKKSE